MTPMQEDVRLAVKRGIGWLDIKYPTWVENINLGELRMECSGSCVIGQVFGEIYNAFVYATVTSQAAVNAGLNASERDDWAVEHGFQPPIYKKWHGETVETDFEKMREYYQLLDEEWTVEIADRQEGNE